MIDGNKVPGLDIPAEAIVKALEGLGVDGFNLKAVGKGSHEPIADNKTETGRAQNRRVVFIKR